VSWKMANGPIPDGLWVLHRCDNRRCVNPAHLFLGTVYENNLDRDRKGRQARGPAMVAALRGTRATGDRNGSRLYPERLVRGDEHWTRRHPERMRPTSGEAHPCARLTVADVAAIRSAREAGEARKSIAARFNVSPNHIYRVVSGRAWAPREGIV
jgi:hypothetical protein